MEVGRSAAKANNRAGWDLSHDCIGSLENAVGISEVPSASELDPDR